MSSNVAADDGVRAIPQATSVLDIAMAALPRLSKSERRVAEEIISNPHRFAEQSMARAAQQSSVSAPTVRRVAQSLGYPGFKALQRALTQELAVGLPAAFSEISAEDDLSSIVVKVFDRILTGLSRVRSDVSLPSLNQAVEALIRAQSAIFLGVGGSKVVALDASQKFAILRVPMLLPGDSHDYFMAISMAPPRTVVLAFSNSGETSDTVRLAQLARSRGLTLIAVTGEAESTLARDADISITAEVSENSDLYAPSASRMAALAVVDVLSAAVTVRLKSDHWEDFKHMKVGLLDYKT